MSEPPETADPGDVVRRLRAAGCVFAEAEAEVLAAAAASAAHLQLLVDERVRGRPLEQVVGWAEFCGIRLVVGPDVFVPRVRTALLAREAVAAARTLPGPVTAVDLCCGCGA